MRVCCFVSPEKTPKINSLAN